MLVGAGLVDGRQTCTTEDGRRTSGGEGSGAPVLSSRTSAASAGIYSPCTEAGHCQVKVDPSICCLRHSCGMTDMVHPSSHYGRAPSAGSY